MNYISTANHALRYSEFRCDHCDGLAEHEPWCVSKNDFVAYAYAIVIDPSAISIADVLVLHSLGVTWNGTEHAMALIEAHAKLEEVER